MISLKTPTVYSFGQLKRTPGDVAKPIQTWQRVLKKNDRESNAIAILSSGIRSLPVHFAFNSLTFLKSLGELC